MKKSSVQLASGSRGCEAGAPPLIVGSPGRELGETGDRGGSTHPPSSHFLITVAVGNNSFPSNIELGVGECKRNT